MTRSTNMEHVEVLERLRDRWAVPDERVALDAAIAVLSAPAEAQPVGEVRMYSGLLYALLDGDFPVGTKLYVHPPPSEPEAQGGGDVEYEYEVWQGHTLQAGGSTSDYATAKSDADHYALMYGQDGPVEVRMYAKRQIISPPSEPVGLARGVAETLAPQPPAEAEIEALRADKSELEAALESLKAHMGNAVMNRDGIIKALEEVRDEQGAEIHRLRAKVAEWKASYQQAADGQAAHADRAERLAEALRASDSLLAAFVREGDEVADAVRKQTAAALRDHEQEVGNG